MACRHIPLSHPTQSPRSINLSISRAIHLPTSPICVCRASASYKIVEPDFSPPICPVKTPNFLMVQRSVPTLLDLPIEIYLQIIGFLDYPSCLALSQTDSFFRALVTVDKPTTSEQKLLYLCTAENWSRYQGYFSCSRCLKLRLREAFADKQVKAKRGKGHAESDRRFCFDCGVKNRMYQPGQKIDINRITYFVCGLCRRLCGSGLYCTVCGGCQRCLQRRSVLQTPYPEIDTRSMALEHSCPRCSRPYEDLGPSTRECDATNIAVVLQNLPLALKLADFQEDFGQMASPEWYEEDIAKGNL